MNALNGALIIGDCTYLVFPSVLEQLSGLVASQDARLSIVPSSKISFTPESASVQTDRDNV